MYVRISIYRKQVTSKDQEMGEVEFKALGPFYGDGDETIKIGERKTFSNSIFKIFHLITTNHSGGGCVGLHQRVLDLLAHSGQILN